MAKQKTVADIALEIAERRARLADDPGYRYDPPDRHVPRDPLATPDFPTRVMVDLPDELYTPLWREAVARDTTVSALVLERLKLGAKAGEQLSALGDKHDAS